MRTYVVLRAGALMVAAVTALLLVVGDHPPEFVVADLLVVALLAVAAVLPSGRLGLMALATGFGVGLGVFTVAFAASVDDGAVSWALASAVVGCLAGISVALRETRPAPLR
ncbi:hypothetical protein [Kribbella shirazensis]|jgi:ABC-type branched-subunit amino acid transport system permease subunit|uniref:ABC-type branched-subunit amino acid transport system permease subunit n=1 Tax=Kribbella shirazensis TaxID=1105143 RepID=A0A7X5VFK4_9ACTN|nr:hypothetical protein [Kribbella shirazensis]NIK60311.1 ABC-type branched-subunit amino acid transport system permease subunit [Kribbella shirazensis]